MVSQELISELTEILAEDFGLELSIDQVVVIANDLTGYFELLIAINNNERSDHD